MNKSKNPTTINEITLNNKYVLNSSSNTFPYIPTNFKHYKKCLVSSDSISLNYPILKPLLELNALDTYEGFLIFNNVEELPSYFDIKINTVQKSKTFHLNLSISNDYRNAIEPEEL